MSEVDSKVTPVCFDKRLQLEDHSQTKHTHHVLIHVTGQKIAHTGSEAKDVNL